MSRNIGKGWRPDTPDVRDRIFSTAKAVQLPAFINNFNQSPIRDQGEEGSCVGHAVGGCFDYLDRIDDTPKEYVSCSPRDVYYKARLERGDENSDSGAEIRLAIKAVARDGVCPDACWPYRQGEWKKKPTNLAKRTSHSFKLSSYERLDSVNSILIAIASHYAVVGGFTCYTNMFTPEVDRTGDVPMPGGSEDGGHAVQFVGYNLPKERLIFKNSWSDQWGNKGYGSLPFEFVEQGAADDFWAMIKEG